MQQDPTATKTKPFRPPAVVRRYYRVQEAARILDCSESLVRRLSREGIVPAPRHKRRYYWGFAELRAARLALGLLRSMGWNGLKRALRERGRLAVRRAFGPEGQPLLSERLVVGDGKLYERRKGRLVDLQTGQAAFDFVVQPPQAKPDAQGRLLALPVAELRRKRARELYLQACRLDEDEATLLQAERLYREALRLDPSMATALTNLANVCYRLGRVEEALAHYERALRLDPSQPEAAYNLGFVHLERGAFEQAIRWFAEAVRREPAFADAHFNLALVYRQLGEHERARAHLREYLRLEPEGPCAELARRYLEEDAGRSGG